MADRVTDIRDLDGLSIKDAVRMPHPADLAAWEGLYEIDLDLGVFRVKRDRSDA